MTDLALQIYDEIRAKNLIPMTPEWFEEARVVSRRLHSHFWIVSMNLDYTEVQDCACGARRKLEKSRDGSEYEVPYVPAATSAENALIKVVAA